MSKKLIYLMSFVLVLAVTGTASAYQQAITVPNGDFEEIYKPGSDTITADLGDGWTQGVGPDTPMDDGIGTYSDGTTGDSVDIPGWIGADPQGWIDNGGSYDRDTNFPNRQGSISRQSSTPDGLYYYLSNGGGWGNPAGGLIVSDAPLGNVENGTYTLSMVANGGATPVVLELLADGVALTPSSSVDPELSGDWQEFSRTYDAASLGDHLGESLTIRLGVGRGASGGQSHFDAVSLSYVTMVPITVPDAGFDDHVLNNVGDYVYVGDATYTGAWKSAGGDAWIDYGYYAGDVDLPALSGNNKLYPYEEVEDYIYQILDETFIEGATYTLSVWVGLAWSGYEDQWSLYFTGEDYTNNLIEASGSAPVGSWQQVSLVYTATAADAGKKIGIKMTGAIYVTFEDVTLSYVAAVWNDVNVATVAELEAAAAAANPGDRINLAAGMYYLTSQIEIKSGVTYMGAGADLTIIDGNDLTRAFVAWGDRGAADGQVDVNGVSVPNITGPTGWVLDGLTIQNCVSDANNRQDILGAARDLLNNYTGTPYTLVTAQDENGGITDNPGWFDILSGSADDDLTDAELQAYLDANPVGSEGHLVVNDDKRDDGGAVCILNGADGTIRNCVFSNNWADDKGGAVCIFNNGSAGTIRNCTFSTNAADDDGGAVMVDGSDHGLAFENCTFDLNTCGDEGGAIKLSSNASIYTITDTTFTGSYAGDDGGAIRADGDDSSYVLTDCTLIGNYASDDGAAVRYGPDRAELTVTNCAFIGNGKDPDGTVVGDFSVWSTHDDDAGPITFMNCLFADNACNDDRFIELKAAFAFLNCTFIGNVAGDKPLIAVRGRPWDSTGDGEDDVTTDDSIISNCLFINNTMLSDGNVIGDTRDDVFTPTVINCLFFGNLDGENPASNTNADSPEVGTIDVSLVTDAAQLVVDPLGDYHLVAGSAAIDASDPATATATDIEGTPAVGVRDVGAYESPAN